VQSAYSWWMPTLWGMGIGIFAGGAVVAVIFLNRMGFIPSWVFGWISSDRDTQKRHFLRMLYGLVSLWAIARFVKSGLFGEIAQRTYNKMGSKLRGFQGETNEEIHARICPVRNVRSAIFLLGFFSYAVFLNWRAVGKPFLEHSLYDLFFRIALFSIVLFPGLLNISRCVPERFILGIMTIQFVAGWVIEFAPTIVGPTAGLVRQCNLALSILAFLISLTMVVSSPSSPKPP
jgi:hypothetical protein